jgi:hypothetical protein
VDALTEAYDQLQAGEHVSGPAAVAYRQRVTTASRFTGRALRTRREAETLLANPELQIFTGRGMTCVLDPARAACRLAADERGHRRTPDIDDCRPTCTNIARTDRDVHDLRRQEAELQEVIDEPLAPPIRHTRERHELARLQHLNANHDQTRKPAT